MILLGKLAAKNDAHNPSNFRPIVLTPCIGELFTVILKNRLLSYVASSGYLETSIQRALANSMPGCFKHPVKLDFNKGIQYCSLLARLRQCFW